MDKLFEKINQIITAEIVSFLIFGLANLIIRFLPEDNLSSSIKKGLFFFYGISAISIPIIIKYLK
jgi:hypothetical protein